MGANPTNTHGGGRDSATERDPVGLGAMFAPQPSRASDGPPSPHLKTAS